jgi:hypothetical protein
MEPTALMSTVPASVCVHYVGYIHNCSSYLLSLALRMHARMILIPHALKPFCFSRASPTPSSTGASPRLRRGRSKGNAARAGSPSRALACRAGARPLVLMLLMLLLLLPPWSGRRRDVPRPRRSRPRRRGARGRRWRRRGLVLEVQRSRRGPKPWRAVLVLLRVAGWLRRWLLVQRTGRWSEPPRGPVLLRVCNGPGKVLGVRLGRLLAC